MQRPLAIDLYTGLHGWASGLVAEGWDVIGFDIEDMCGQFDVARPEHVHLVIQNVLTLHGRQFRDAALVVASPPCQEFSYMAMPWKRAKALAPEEIGVDVPAWWAKPEGKMDAAELDEWRAWKRDHPKPPPSLALVNACFRIQHEASEAAGRHVPMVLENVRGAVDWIGRPQYNYGSFYLWGDVPVFMPKPEKAAKVPGFRFDGSGRSFQTASVNEGLKHGGDWFSDPSSPSRQGGQVKAVAEGRKGAGAGAEWFDGNLCVKSSNSPARKRASAMIAKIPEPLSRWIGRCYHPRAGALTEGPDRF